MVVISSCGSNTGAGSPLILVINIGHVSCIIMIRHNDGPLPVVSRNNHHEVPLEGMAILIFYPAAPPVKVKIGFPLKGKITGKCFPLHSLLSYNPSVIGKKIITQSFQVSLMMYEFLLSGSIQDTIRIGFIKIFSGRQIANIFPVLDFKGAQSTAVESQGSRQCLFTGRGNLFFILSNQIPKLIAKALPLLLMIVTTS